MFQCLEAHNDIKRLIRHWNVMSICHKKMGNLNGLRANFNPPFIQIKAKLF